jgi:hypothetical protein
MAIERSTLATAYRPPAISLYTVANTQGKRRPLKKIVARAKAGAKKRRARRVKRRETVVEKVKHLIGLE